MTKGERHHLKRKVAQMETIPNLCANEEDVHKNMPKKHDVPRAGHHGEETTRMVVGKRFFCSSFLP
jgi:hypothetical protein